MGVLRVTVEDSDIAQGEKRDNSQCPLARAIRRTTGASFTSVGRSTCGWDENEPSVLPAEASSWVDDFDNNRPVYPFSFLLNVGDKR